MLSDDVKLSLGVVGGYVERAKDLGFLPPQKLNCTHPQGTKASIMHSSGIVFSTSNNFQFTWLDEFEGIETWEFEALILECRSAISAFLTELNHRKHVTARDTKHEKLQHKLISAAKRFDESGLQKEDAKFILDRKPTLQMTLARSLEVTSNQPDFYLDLLWLIRRLIGNTHLLLVICTIAKTSVKTRESAMALVRFTAQNSEDLFCVALESRAMELGIR